MSKTFRRTVIRMVVLSEDPIPEALSLLDIVGECEEGGYVLAAVDTRTSVLDDIEMAHALYAAGSDPDFFEIGA